MLTIFIYFIKKTLYKKEHLKNGEVNLVDTQPLFRDDAKKEVKKFEIRNGTLKSFNTKDVVILLHKETQSKIKELDIKIEKHIGQTQREDTRIVHVLADHDKIMQHVMDTLPEKGFCEKVTNELGLDDKKVNLSDKVDVLWHDRRWIKKILTATLAAILAIGGGNLVLQILGV